MNVATSGLFSQLLSLIERNRFAKLVRETGSERPAKGFAGWDHSFAMLFYQVPGNVSLHAPGRKFRFKSKLFSLDSTVIELCGNMFDWA